MEQMTTRPTKVRIYGSTAVVIGDMTYTVKGMPAPGQIVYTRVYVNNGGKWSLVSHQSTIPAPPRNATGSSSASR
jgi:hypothetical protein